MFQKEKEKKKSPSDLPECSFALPFHVGREDLGADMKKSTPLPHSTRVAAEREGPQCFKVLSLFPPILGARLLSPKKISCHIMWLLWASVAAHLGLLMPLPISAHRGHQLVGRSAPSSSAASSLENRNKPLLEKPQGYRTVGTHPA